MSTNLQPLKLTWGLSSDLVLGGNPIHMDALVAFAKTQQRLAEFGLSGEVPDEGATVRGLAAELPLAKATQGDAWVWKASALCMVQAPTVRGMRFFTRKSNPYDIAARTALKQFETTFQRDRRLAGRAASPDKPMKPYAGKIDVTRGLNKNMFKFFPVVSARQLQAWCIGDEDELYSLLSPEAGFVTHIGPRKRSGLGEVVDFKIEPDEAAHDLWSRRVLPWPHEGAVSMRLAARPPYWAAENEAMNYIHPSLFT